MKIWIVIPAYNEGNTIGGVLDKLRERDLSILVIDDGSRDNTFEAADKRSTKVLRNPCNQGKGLALKRGIMYLLKEDNFDYVIIMDADSQHSPHDLDQFIEEAEKGGRFIIGNRMERPTGMPLIRVWTNKLMSFLISKIVGQKIPDSQCGFRLISRDVLENISIETKKYQVESEILIKSAWQGVSIKSVPIKSIYSKDAKSKINPFLDTLRFIKFILTLKRGA